MGRIAILLPPGRCAMRFFTTEGLVNCVDHYGLLPLVRINLEEIRELIAQKK